MVRAVLFGVGEAAAVIARYALEKNIEIVGAFSRSSGVGQDLGLYLELGRALGVEIRNDPVDTLRDCNAHIALLATQSSLSSQLEPVRVCLGAGLDILSVAEEGFHPPPFGDGGAAGQIDRWARLAGKTVFFGGVQDVFWFDALLSLTGAAQSIASICGSTVSDLEDLGPNTLGSYPLGLTAREFDEFLGGPGAKDVALGAMGPAVDAVLSTLGFSVATRDQRIEPIYAESDMHCAVLDTTIVAGRTCGIAEVLELTTTNDIEVRAEFVSTILTEEQTPLVRWEIRGNPNLEVVFDRFPGHEVTASNVINRIPSVLAAPAGYRSVVDLPAPRYWAGVQAIGDRTVELPR